MAAVQANRQTPQCVGCGAGLQSERCPECDPEGERCEQCGFYVCLHNGDVCPTAAQMAWLCHPTGAVA